MPPFNTCAATISLLKSSSPGPLFFALIFFFSDCTLPKVTLFPHELHSIVTEHTSPHLTFFCLVRTPRHFGQGWRTISRDHSWVLRIILGPKHSSISWDNEICGITRRDIRRRCVRQCGITRRNTEWCRIIRRRMMFSSDNGLSCIGTSGDVASSSSISGTKASDTRAAGSEAAGRKASCIRGPGSEAAGSRASGNGAPGSEASGSVMLGCVALFTWGWGCAKVVSLWMWEKKRAPWQRYEEETSWWE